LYCRQAALGEVVVPAVAVREVGGVVSRSVLPHGVEHTAETHRVAYVTSSLWVVSSEMVGFVIFVEAL
jgi:purine nucleoside phosphorylase